MLFRINNLGYYAVCPLTTSIDNFVGKSLDVEFTGVTGEAGAATLNTGDTLTGGPGVSTFNITGNGNGTNNIAIVETSGIQAVNVRAVVDTTINQVLMSGVTAASSQNSLGSVTFTNAQLATTYGLFNTNNLATDFADLSVTYQAASGTADTALLSINNAGGKVGSTTVTQTINTTASTGDIEAISLATAGSNQVKLAGGAKVAAVDVSGNGTNTITLTSAATTMTLDASESSGTNTLIVGDLLSTTDTILGGSGTDTLRGNLSTATQMLPSVTGVETLDLTFTAAGIFNATNVAGATKLIVTNTAAATFTNVSDDVVDVQVGKTADVTGSGLTVGYATGSVSDVKLTVGATPSTTGATAAVSTGDVTFTGNKAGLRVESVGTAKNTVGAMVVDAVTSLALVGKSQALDVAGNVSAKAATDLTVDATAKNVTQVGSVKVIADESLSTLTVTSGAGVATVRDVEVLASKTTAAIDLTIDITAGAKNVAVGTFDIDGDAASVSGSSVNVTANLTSTAGVGSTSGYVEVTGIDINEGATSSSSLALNMAADAGNVTLTTLDLADVDSTAIVVSAASSQTATIANLDGTSNLTTITASGAGTISLFNTATTAVVGDTVVDSTGTTGNFTVNLGNAASTNDVSVTLGNAATGKANIVTTGYGADVVTGGTGVDSIYGGAGADVISAGAGNDLLMGGVGADLLSGNAGDDVFVYSDGDATIAGTSTGTATSATATITLSGDYAAGEVISISDLDYAGTAAAVTYTVQFGDTLGDIADGLAAAIEAATAGVNYTATASSGVVTLVGEGTGTFAAAVSEVLTTANTGITLAAADTITDFSTGDDTISAGFAGTTANVTIADGGSLTAFAQFEALATTAFNGTVTAFVSYDALGSGNAYVAIDRNGTGTFDQGDTLFILEGVDAATGFVVSDFIS